MSGDDSSALTPRPRRKLLSDRVLKVPRPVPPPPPELRLRLRTKLVIAMALAALVPVAIIAMIATGVILSSLEGGLREDADRQLTVGLNFILRSVERLGDESVQLAEASDLAIAMHNGPLGLEAWFAREGSHLPSARVQLVDVNGAIPFDRVAGGNEERFDDIGVSPGDPIVIAGLSWTRSVTLVAVHDVVVVRAVSPIVDTSLQLLGVAVLSMPLDGDFADSIKGALSADVLLGGTSGHLEPTFRSSLGRRIEPIVLSARDRDLVLRGQRVLRDLGVKIEKTGALHHYTMAASTLLDNFHKPVGLVAVAVDRAPLAATKALAIRSLVIGGLGALAFALVLALFWSRRLGAPIAELHRGAIAVSRGDLDHRIDIPGGDELTDLAEAFNQMTSTLKDNQARLAARMKEIVALHDAGRAVSSVIDLDQVSRKIVDAVARTFDVQLAALWLVVLEQTGPQGVLGRRSSAQWSTKLRASAARARRPDVSSVLATDEALAAAEVLRPIAERVRDGRAAVRLVRAADDAHHGETAIAAGTPGPFIALPLERKNRIVGVLAVARSADAREFSDADLNLLTTFADQAGAAVENAQLYQEVRGASEELEKKVKLRTSELTAINTELGKALADLRETQAQLVLSERMAGLGVLVAGVAHEINSPTAAIRGSIDGLGTALSRVASRGAEVAQQASTPDVARTITEMLDELAPQLAERPLPTGLTARKVARELASQLTDAGVSDAQVVAAELADLGATRLETEQFIAALPPKMERAGFTPARGPEMERAGFTPARGPEMERAGFTPARGPEMERAGFTPARGPEMERAGFTPARGGTDRALAVTVIGALTDHVYLHRTASTVRRAVGQIQRIVGALKSYSHLDQQATRSEADLHEGLETTLTLLHHALRDIVIERRYGVLPRVPVFVDELNQVWTNLISNAQQALGGRGTIIIETLLDAGSAVVRVIDHGPGVPHDVLPRIFEPFFTTKAKGEGTGLGLGIARQIVAKHGGDMHCKSEPGRTMFEVRLPIDIEGVA